MDSIEEKSILKRFKLHYPNFPNGKICYPDKPDVVVKGKTIVGIEITQLFKDQDSNKGSFLKAMEIYKRKLLIEIVSGLKRKSFSKCIVSVVFNPNSYSNKVKPKIIAEKCIEDIFEKFSSLKTINQTSYTIENDSQLPELISSYSLWFDTSIENTDFVETTGSLGFRITNREIQFILDKKEKSKKSFHKCDLYWLIIKYSSFGADYFSSVKLNPNKLITSFDNVFLINPFESEIRKII